MPTSTFGMLQTRTHAAYLTCVQREVYIQTWRSDALSKWCYFSISIAVPGMYIRAASVPGALEKTRHLAWNFEPWNSYSALHSIGCGTYQMHRTVEFPDGPLYNILCISGEVIHDVSFTKQQPSREGLEIVLSSSLRQRRSLKRAQRISFPATGS